MSSLFGRIRYGKTPRIFEFSCLDGSFFRSKPKGKGNCYRPNAVTSSAALVSTISCTNKSAVPLVAWEFGSRRCARFTYKYFFLITYFRFFSFALVHYLRLVWVSADNRSSYSSAMPYLYSFHVYAPMGTWHTNVSKNVQKENVCRLIHYPPPRSSFSSFSFSQGTLLSQLLQVLVPELFVSSFSLKRKISKNLTGQKGRYIPFTGCSSGSSGTILFSTNSAVGSSCSKRKQWSIH